MGGQPTKEDSVQLKKAVERVQNCLKNHESNVSSITSGVNAQSESVQILSTIMPDYNENDNTESENPTKSPLAMTQSLLFHIQSTLNHQVEALNKSFKLLNDCIQDLSPAYLGLEPGTSVDKDRRGDISARTKTQTDTRFDTVSYESERRSEGIVEHETPDRRGGHMDISYQAMNKLLVSEKQELQNKQSVNEGLIKAFQEENNRQSAETEQLKDSIKSKEEELSCFIKKKDEIKKKCDRLEKENKQLNGEMSKHRHDAEKIYSLENRVRHTEEKEKEIRHLQNTVDGLNRKIYALEDEKRRIKEKKMLVPVQLYFQRRDELMTLVVNELSTMLDTQFQTKNLQLEIVRCENSASIQPDRPVLVLCINSSRLGTDASAAIDGVQRSGRTALLIFHHKNSHALPNQSSDRMLTSSEFKQLGGIFDLAFLSGKGIYPCDMNNQALSSIESFIQRNIQG